MANVFEEFINDTEEQLKEIKLKLKENKELNKELAFFLTINLWSKLDVILKQQNTYEEFLKSVKFKDFNSSFLKLLQKYFISKHGITEFFSKAKGKRKNDSIFLLNIIKNMDSLILGNLPHNKINLEIMASFFFDLSRTIHIKEDLSYVFIYICLFNNKNKIMVMYPNQSKEMSFLEAWKWIKKMRNEMVHTEIDNSEVTNVDNWEKIYWRVFKKIIEEIIDIGKKNTFSGKLKRYGE